MYEVSYWIRAQAWMRPESVAVVGDGIRWTYRELDAEVERISRRLTEGLGLARGERIALLSANGPAFLTLLLAAGRAGLVLVPLNWRLVASELAFQVQDSGARRVFCSAEYAAVAAEVSGRLGLDPPLLMPGEAAGMGLEHLAAGWVAEAPADPGEGGAAPEEEPLPWDLPLVIAYTSGTTGQPKGAVLTSANFFWNAMNDLLAVDIRSDDAAITLLPMFHIGGLGLFTLPTLLAGGKVVIPSRFDPAEALRLMEAERITLVFGVPAIHQRLLAEIDRLRPDLSSVRMFYSGGAPCPEDLISAFQARGYRFGQGYGLTETAPTVFMLLQPDFVRKSGSIGRPAAFSRARLVAPGTGRPVAPGEVGEIVTRGPHLFAGYWQNEEATRQAMQDGWFCTGDLARADGEGYVTIAGRLKEMIISGGENIYPVEVEQAIQRHPQVVEAAVFGVPDPRWGEAPHAAVVPAPGAALTEEELRRHCSLHLARYKVPKRFHLVEALPRNASGKVLKRELAASLGNGGEDRAWSR